MHLRSDCIPAAGHLLPGCIFGTKNDRFATFLDVFRHFCYGFSTVFAGFCRVNGLLFHP